MGIVRINFETFKRKLNISTRKHLQVDIKMLEPTEDNIKCPNLRSRSENSDSENRNKETTELRDYPHSHSKFTNVNSKHASHSSKFVRKIKRKSRGKYHEPRKGCANWVMKCN